MKPEKIRFSEQDIRDIINSLEIANRDQEYINDVERKLRSFAEFTNYEFDFNTVTEFLNKVKKQKSAYDYRKYVLFVRKLLKNVGAPYWDKLVLPKVPKPKKIIIKKPMVKQVILNLWNLRINPVTKFRAISAFMLGATSGLRAEEITRLEMDDIDLENRIVYVRFGKSKDVEERVTFFNYETQAILQYYFEVYDDQKELFNERSLRYLYERYPEVFRVGGLNIRLKHMRKFFIQDWERRGGSLATRKMLAGGSTEDEEKTDPKRLLTGHNSVEIELESYNYQDPEDLKKIYDAVGIRIFD